MRASLAQPAPNAPCPSDRRMHCRHRDLALVNFEKSTPGLFRFAAGRIRFAEGNTIVTMYAHLAWQCLERQAKRMHIVHGYASNRVSQYCWS